MGAINYSYGKSYTLYPNFPVAGETLFNFVLLPGTIRDYVTGTALSGVNIFARSQSFPFLEAQTSTNSDGVFQLIIPEGTYAITAICYPI
jgi:hypothetical protein